ncbi:hypothetical protein DOM22_16810 [Bdellovibrio sp. ZAP7]|uniref:hypothetical protein n=1 Tax=Bdellovibrio sp. ZAP7 TaxID=2231053 RepID=UPI0011598424|nr:hypothetical protein [Bdellovibrio sp. ZAP7]QDK46696.1 hypothetical protein DOM22_16810 [Bdellovibrio sp. ZAP7]
MKNVFKSLLAVYLFVGSVAQAGELNGPALRDELTKVLGPAAIQKVLKDSKDYSSPIGKLIVKNDIEDGRNHNGNINLPLSPKDIQITLIDGEDQFGFYCDERECSNGKHGVFLVAIASQMGVHKAVSFDTVKFLVRVELTNAFPKTEDGWDESKGKTTIEATFMKEVKIDIYSAE